MIQLTYMPCMSLTRYTADTHYTSTENQQENLQIQNTLSTKYMNVAIYEVFKHTINIK